MIYQIFLINPGSTTTKVGYFENDRSMFTTTVRHTLDEIHSLTSVMDEVNFRYNVVKKVAAEHNCDLTKIDAFAARCGFIKPLPGGTYLVNDAMYNDLFFSRYGTHASNMGPLIARKLSYEYGKPALVTNPVCTDEYMDIARISGLPELERTPIFHALNTKEVGHRAAHQLGKQYNECRFVIAHLGGGMSVGAHEYGRVIDTTSPAEEGPICVTRAGTLPSLKLAKLCYSGKYTWPEMQKLLSSQAGLFAYTQEADMLTLEARAEKEPQVKLLLEACAYRIAFYICAYAAALNGDLDAVIVTGAIAHSKKMVAMIQKRVGFLAPFMVFPGEFEMEGLASGALRVLSGQEIAKCY